MSSNVWDISASGLASVVSLAATFSGVGCDSMFTVNLSELKVVEDALSSSSSRNCKKFSF
jgi:hypothetical protein